MARKCAICDRELHVVEDVARYVTSGATKNSYCLPGEGCWVETEITQETKDEPLNVLSEPEVVKLNDLANRFAKPTEAISVPAQET